MKQRILALLLVAAMVFGAYGCGSKAGTDAGSDQGSTTVKEESETPDQTANPKETDAGTNAQDSYTVGILVVSTQSQWCNELIDGITSTAESYGNKVIVSDSQVSGDNEISGMENLINSGCNAIVVNAMNPGGLVDLCKEAQDKGIYIIGFSDLLVNYDALVVENPAKDAQMMSAQISQWVNEELGGTCEMAEIWLSDSKNPETTAGVFKDAFEKEFQKTLFDGMGIEMVNGQYVAETNAAMDTAEAILTANPGVKVIFCQSDELAVSVIQAIEAKGIDTSKMFICGRDGTKEAISSIAGGSCLRATVYVNTTGVGRQIGECVQKMMAEGIVENVEQETILINADNASEYVAQ